MYTIKLTNKKDEWVKTVCRRDTSLDEINAQAEWIWSLLNKKEKAQYRVSVHGLAPQKQRFDSDCMN